MQKVGNPIVIKRRGKVVSTSKNLRGLLDYGRRHLVAKVQAVPAPIGRSGYLVARYSDGAVGRARFADFGVLVRWVQSRRSWELVPMLRGGPIRVWERGRRR